MKKIIFGSLITLALLGYFARDYISLAKYLRYASLSEGCISDEEERKMKMKNISMDEQDAIARKTFTCIKNKQGFIERMLIPVPKEWINTPSDSK